jgi:hypothetical protein
MGEVKSKVIFTNIFDEYLHKEKIRQVELDCLIHRLDVRPESPFLPLLKMK